MPPPPDLYVQADIFSYAMLAHEVLHGFLNIYRLPNAASRYDLDRYAAGVAAGHRPPLDIVQLPEALAALIARCWDEVSARRCVSSLSARMPVSCL